MSKHFPKKHLTENEKEMLDSVDWDEEDKANMLRAGILNELREFNHKFDEFARMMQDNSS